MRRPLLARTLAGAGCLLGLLALQPSQAEPMVARAEPIPDQVWAGMQGSSWHAGRNCPPRAGLVLLTVPYLDFDGRPRLGRLVVARRVAKEAADAFTEIFRAGTFRIQRMELVDAYGGDDDKSMAANNTSAFNCRTVAGTGRMSLHALGLAIDVNPVQNPWVQGAETAPEAGKSYDEPGERSQNVIGLIKKGDAVTTAFLKRGWRWGGDWKSSKDYQHFERR